MVKEGSSGVISRDHLLTKNRNPLKQIYVEQSSEQGKKQQSHEHLRTRKLS